MYRDIENFVLAICRKYKLNANYIPDGDIWMIHKQGRAVQNFNSRQFYEIPKRARMSQFEPLVRLGMNQNLISNPDQMFIRRDMGRVIA
jgi:hypothetical protein